MNLPNKLTILRVFMIPVFIFAYFADFIPANNIIALVIFVLASFTDMLDGKIARKYNLVTNFGKFMDPIADKLLVVSALICVLVRGKICPNLILSTTAVLIIIFREFIISGFREVAADSGVVIAASYFGKLKTVFQMVAIGLMLADIEAIAIVKYIITGIAVALTVFSLVDYLTKNKGVLQEKK